MYIQFTKLNPVRDMCVTAVCIDLFNNDNATQYEIERKGINGTLRLHACEYQLHPIIKLLISNLSLNKDNASTLIEIKIGLHMTKLRTAMHLHVYIWDSSRENDNSLLYL